ncbi:MULTISPECIES: DUF4262 domain-containing protein [unclassified Streptomyces]|uniref:DUF4262 domain-containing protein n=1 Tax=unclassified Streptomyces TaxID=2593676 RepID=UPI0033A7698F
MPGRLAITTSRQRLDALIVADNARFIPLGLLSDAEGIELLEHRLGKDRVGAEIAAAQDIVDLCGRLPLALAIAAARAVLHPTFPLASIAWYRACFGGAVSFCRRPPFPVVQMVWPDAGGRFLWQSGTDASYRQSRPQLWEQPAQHPKGVRADLSTG